MRLVTVEVLVLVILFVVVGGAGIFVIVWDACQPFVLHAHNEGLPCTPDCHLRRPFQRR